MFIQVSFVHQKDILCCKSNYVQLISVKVKGYVKILAWYSSNS